MILLREYTEVLSGDEKKHIVAEFSVDNSSELPSQEYGEYYLHMGSIAHDVSTGDFYAIDSAGTWHIQSGTSAPEEETTPEVEGDE